MRYIVFFLVLLVSWEGAMAASADDDPETKKRMKALAELQKNGNKLNGADLNLTRNLKNSIVYAVVQNTGATSISELCDMVSKGKISLNAITPEVQQSIDRLTGGHDSTIADFTAATQRQLADVTAQREQIRNQLTATQDQYSNLMAEVESLRAQLAAISAAPAVAPGIDPQEMERLRAAQAAALAALGNTKDRERENALQSLERQLKENHATALRDLEAEKERALQELRAILDQQGVSRLEALRQAKEQELRDLQSRLNDKHAEELRQLQARMAAGGSEAQATIDALKRTHEEALAQLTRAKDAEKGTAIKALQEKMTREKDEALAALGATKDAEKETLRKELAQKFDAEMAALRGDKDNEKSEALKQLGEKLRAESEAALQALEAKKNQEKEEALAALRAQFLQEHAAVLDVGQLEKTKTDAEKEALQQAFDKMLEEKLALLTLQKDREKEEALMALQAQLRKESDRALADFEAQQKATFDAEIQRLKEALAQAEALKAPPRLEQATVQTMTEFSEAAATRGEAIVLTPKTLDLLGGEDPNETISILHGRVAGGGSQRSLLSVSEAFRQYVQTETTENILAMLQRGLKLEAGDSETTIATAWRGHLLFLGADDVSTFKAQIEESVGVPGNLSEELEALAREMDSTESLSISIPSTRNWVGGKGAMSEAKAALVLMLGVPPVSEVVSGETEPRVREATLTEGLAMIADLIQAGLLANKDAIFTALQDISKKFGGKERSLSDSWNLIDRYLETTEDLPGTDRLEKAQQLCGKMGIYQTLKSLNPFLGRHDTIEADMEAIAPLIQSHTVLSFLEAINDKIDDEPEGKPTDGQKKKNALDKADELLKAMVALSFGDYMRGIQSIFGTPSLKDLRIFRDSFGKDAIGGFKRLQISVGTRPNTSIPDIVEKHLILLGAQTLEQGSLDLAESIGVKEDAIQVVQGWERSMMGTDIVSKGGIAVPLNTIIKETDSSPQHPFLGKLVDQGVIRRNVKGVPQRPQAAQQAAGGDVIDPKSPERFKRSASIRQSLKKSQDQDALDGMHADFEDLHKLLVGPGEEAEQISISEIRARAIKALGEKGVAQGLILKLEEISLEELLGLSLEEGFAAFHRIAGESIFELPEGSPQMQLSKALMDRALRLNSILGAGTFFNACYLSAQMMGLTIPELLESQGDDADPQYLLKQVLGGTSTQIDSNKKTLFNTVAKMKEVTGDDTWVSCIIFGLHHHLDPRRQGIRLKQSVPLFLEWIGATNNLSDDPYDPKAKPTKQQIPEDQIVTLANVQASVDKSLGVVKKGQEGQEMSLVERVGLAHTVVGGEDVLKGLQTTYSLLTPAPLSADNNLGTEVSSLLQETNDLLTTLGLEAQRTLKEAIAALKAHHLKK